MGGRSIVCCFRRGGSKMSGRDFLMMQRCPSAAVGRLFLTQRRPGAAEEFVTLLNPLIRVIGSAITLDVTQTSKHAIVMVN